jgi:hypothetical protein
MACRMPRAKPATRSSRGRSSSDPSASVAMRALVLLRDACTSPPACAELEPAKPVRRASHAIPCCRLRCACVHVRVSECVSECVSGTAPRALVSTTLGSHGRYPLPTHAIAVSRPRGLNLPNKRRRSMGSQALASLVRRPADAAGTRSVCGDCRPSWRTWDGHRLEHTTTASRQPPRCMHGQTVRRAYPLQFPPPANARRLLLPRRVPPCAAVGVGVDGAGVESLHLPCSPH